MGIHVFNPDDPAADPATAPELQATRGMDKFADEFVTFSGKPFLGDPRDEFPAGPHLPPAWLLEIVDEDQVTADEDELERMTLQPHIAGFEYLDLDGDGEYEIVPDEALITKGTILRRYRIAHQLGFLEDPDDASVFHEHLIPYREIVWEDGVSIDPRLSDAWNGLPGTAGWSLQYWDELGLITLLYTQDSRLRTYYFPTGRVDTLTGFGVPSSEPCLLNEPQIAPTTSPDRDPECTFGLLTGGVQIFSRGATEAFGGGALGNQDFFSQVPGVWTAIDHFPGTPERLRLTPIEAPDPLIPVNVS